METLERAEQLKAELDSLRPLDAEAEARIMQKFRLDWNYHSNKLEGNSYSYGETKMLLLFGLTAGGKPIRDHEEISGHDDAINYIIDVIKQNEPLTEVFIRHLHKLILVKPYRTDAKTPDGLPTKKLVKVGEYKTEPNHVETQTGEIFYFAEPIETPAKMQELVEWFRSKIESSDTNAVLLAAEFHYRFIRIHPFDDGNGRLARLLMNFILMQYSFPPVVIKNEDKENYIAVLRQADAGVLQPFIEYIAQYLIRSLEIMIKGARGEDIEEPEDLDKELALLERNLTSLKDDTPITKNSIVVLEIFDNSIVNLTIELLKMCKKFDRFYKAKSFSLIINGQSAHSQEEDALSLTKKYLSNHVPDPVSFRFQYIHSNLKNEGFENVGWISGVNITFDLAKFIVMDDNGVNQFVKLYGDQLKSEEINKIVNDLAKLHKHFIETEMVEVRNRVDEIKETIKDD